MRWRKPIWELAVTGHVLARCSTVAAVVWDSWSHVCGPVLDWPCALRWWWQLTSLIHWEYELSVVCLTMDRLIGSRRRACSLSISPSFFSPELWLPFHCHCVREQTVGFSFPSVLLLLFRPREWPLPFHGWLTQLSAVWNVTFHLTCTLLTPL